MCFQLVRVDNWNFRRSNSIKRHQSVNFLFRAKVNEVMLEEETRFVNYAGRWRVEAIREGRKAGRVTVKHVVSNMFR